MCQFCAFGQGAIAPVGPSSDGAGPLTDYTPPATLPTFTLDQIIQALRTSYEGENNTTPVANDHVTIQNTFSWNRFVDIVWRFDATTLSTVESARLDLAFETWDELIATDIRNSQTAGDAGAADQNFINAMYDGGSRAFAQNTTTVQTNDDNGYGTTQFFVTRASLVLGRGFNNGEFDGRVGNGGNPDNGTDDLTLFSRRGFETVLHEVGHAIGLSHPGFYNNGHVSIAAGARFDQDSRRNTIMSYQGEGNGADSNANWNGLFVSTPMVYDIAAIQRIYGADTNTRTGADRYGFSNSTGRVNFNFSTTLGSVFAIWDAGGYDTLDASQFNTAARIDLTPGSYSSIGQAQGNAGAAMAENIGIAFNCFIEGAVGGNGADTIIGNATNNTLVGGNGVDTIFGGDSNDILQGGAGLDRLDGGNGPDVASYADRSQGIVARLSLDMDNGSQGKVTDAGSIDPIDILTSIEGIEGSNFADQIEGDEQVNWLRGGGGNDQISGLDGNDTLDGGAGDDVLAGGDGVDNYDGGDGIDTVAFLAPVTLNLFNGFRAGEVVGETFTRMERFLGSNGDDVLEGGYTGVFFAGNAGNDNLTGSVVDDWIQGGEGYDTINGGGGDDIASYADSTTRIFARLDLPMTNGSDGKITNPSSGSTEIDYITSIESIEGSNFDDQIIGDERWNRLWGLGGNDEMAGGTGIDNMWGGAGDDRVTVAAGDNAWGDDGTDTLTVSGASVSLELAFNRVTIDGVTSTVQGFETVSATAGNDVLRGVSGSASTFLGGDGADELYGAEADDYLDGGAGDDYIYGGLDDDMMVVGAGADTMDGAEGRDTVLFTRASVVDWLAGVSVDELASDFWYNFEIIQGSSGNDTFRTPGYWGFAIELRGGGGNDILATEQWNDALIGQAGNDDLRAGAGNDQVDGGVGNDRLEGGSGNDVLRPGAGNDVIFGGAGTDLLSYQGLTGAVLIDLASTAAQNTRGAGTDRASSVEQAAGGSGGDTLRGNALANVLYGNGGNDVLEGRGGNDNLQGGGGNDTLRGGLGNDSLAGGIGRDLASYSDATRAVRVDLAVASAQNTGGGGTDRITACESASGGTASDTLRGNALANMLYGNGGNDLLEGRTGNDGLQGGAGNDTLRGGLGNDRIDGSTGLDTASYTDIAAALLVDLAITAAQNTRGAGIDTIVACENVGGGSAADALRGNAGSNQLFGNAGNDVLLGRAGLDRLMGGSGADDFVFRNGDLGPTGAAIETITDFVSGTDDLNLEAIDANRALAGDQDFVFVGAAAFTNSGQARFSGGVLQLNTGGSLAADLVLALNGVTRLVAADFVDL